jgi:hypothetical protein
VTARDRDAIRGFLGEAHQEMLIGNEDYAALLDRLDRIPPADEIVSMRAVHAALWMTQAMR